MAFLEQKVAKKYINATKALYSKRAFARSKSSSRIINLMGKATGV